jgi:DNA-binding XRE family transcriptional regulator
MKINTEQLADDIASMRKHKELSLDKACKEIGISKPTLSRVENGKNLDSLTLLKVCKWLCVNPINYLNQQS